jgi:hypothetical protein
MTEPLSSEGQQRRDEILRAAKRQARSRRRRRRLVTGAGLGATCAILLAVLLTSRSSAPQQNTAPHSVAYVATAPSTQSGRIVIGTIHNDLGLADRLAVPIRSPQWETIGDEELIRLIGDAGQSAGIIRAEGEATLLLSSAAQ